MFEYDKNSKCKNSYDLYIRRNVNENEKEKMG